MHQPATETGRPVAAPHQQAGNGSQRWISPTCPPPTTRAGRARCGWPPRLPARSPCGRTPWCAPTPPARRLRARRGAARRLLGRAGAADRRLLGLRTGSAARAAAGRWRTRVGLIVMERATQALVYPTPLYSWAWKHDAVIEHLLTAGGLQTRRPARRHGRLRPVARLLRRPGRAGAADRRGERRACTWPGGRWSPACCCSRRCC